jgi:hypothetical protein
LAFFIHPNQCLIFFHDPKAVFTPVRMKQALAADGVTAEGDTEPIALRWANGPKLYASIIRGDGAAFLAGRLMGRGRKYRTLAAECDAYVEIKFDNLDEVLDEINTLIQVQSTLQKATGGLLYCSWNQSFSGPEE